MRAAATAVMLFAVLFLSLPAGAQQEGPLTPPSGRAGEPESRPPETPATQASTPAAQRTSSGISNRAPSIPVEEIIQRFAEREAEFKRERENYTYTQSYVVQTLDARGRPDGEYRMTSEIVFTPEGKRYEKIVDAPPPTLERVSLSREDLDDLEHVQPFVLTSEELPKYDIRYVGREQVDELSTYVFDVAPKKMEKNQRYFQGRIWVDDRDLEIVKTYGKAVPDIRKGRNENVFPRFETYRENIEGDYWFPTYTRANDVLHYSSGNVHILMTVRYANYKRFTVTSKIKSSTEVKPDHP